MQRIFHTPEGVRDIYGTECVQKKNLEERLHRVFSLHGFADIETPSFEFFEVFSNEVGTIPSSELYKFFDRENNTLVLRPDFTPSVSRACAAHFSPDEHPVNLCYTGNAFVNPSRYQGRLRETTQMGVEKMGDDSPQADAEILAMAVECLMASGLKEFQISIGQVDYFKSLLQEVDLDSEAEERLRELISQKNYYAVEELVRSAGFDEKTAKAFFMLPQMFGSAQILDTAASLTDNPRALAAVDRLREIHTYLTAYGYDRYVTFDFGMLSKYQYYTGIIFQGYTYGTGEPLIKGGRYDRLLKHFGKDAPSVGFVIVVDSLLAALEGGAGSFPEEEPATVLRYRADDTCEAIRQAQRLRGEGHRVIMELEKGEKA
ncbi:MAG: ATP phosphoribosyltransferase regulatory subunit [Blautia sp.]|nr:ATP phosphoribosyltransferase regulatory subunit [Blautia sp.]